MEKSLTPSPTWTRIDSSKLQDYLMCPRYYFYSHILGWKGEEPNHDLVFGQAWHAAMQYLAIHGYSDEDVTEAFDKFLDVYRPYFSVETDELYRAICLRPRGL
jgi:hypothetical protein